MQNSSIKDYSVVHSWLRKNIHIYIHSLYGADNTSEMLVQKLLNNRPLCQVNYILLFLLPLSCIFWHRCRDTILYIELVNLWTGYMREIFNAMFEQIFTFISPIPTQRTLSHVTISRSGFTLHCFFVNISHKWHFFDKIGGE